VDSPQTLLASKAAALSKNSGPSLTTCLGT
jgi:hypothetical protein